jgi:1-acyl-sn-glycerol-3-phosphate acyltransferase
MPWPVSCNPSPGSVRKVTGTVGAGTVPGLRVQFVQDITGRDSARTGRNRGCELCALTWRCWVSPYEVARWFVACAFRLVWRPTIVGVQHLPREGAVILASNHRSFIDSVVIPLAVPRRVTFLAKAEYFEGRGLRGWWSRTFFHVVGAVPIRRGGRRDSLGALDTALETLSRGAAFGIYPEGTRSRDGRLYRGRTGVGWLALTSGAPVVPVALTGTERIQPIGARVPKVRRLRVEFGPVVDPAPWRWAVEASGGAGRARREITDEVMSRIARMSGQETADDYNTPPQPSLP